MGHILIGLLITGAGTAMAMKASWLYEQFGSVAFAEKYLGTAGGTRLFYKLIGMLAIFIGILTITNLHQSFFLWVLSPLINAGGMGGRSVSE